MTLYRAGYLADVPLLQWYCQLAANGDLQRTMGASLWGMGAFMQNFTTGGGMLFFEEDEAGWWMTSWVFPFMGGGTWGLWVRPDKRASGARQGLAHIMVSLAVGLEKHPVLVNTTKQDDIVAKTQRLGYTYLGKIPLLFDGETCHVLYMTRETFAPIYERWSARNGESRRKD